MKNNLKILALSFFALLVSCADLEENPVGELSPNGYYNTVEDIYPMIDGAYGLFASSSYYGAGITVPLQLMSDMVANGFEYSDYAEFSPFLAGPDNSYVRRVWAVSYQIILTANSAIEGAVLIDEPDDAKRNMVAAEARFVRAFTYYHLVRLYGNIPYIESTEIDDVKAVTQSTPAEVYAKIIEDLTFAFEHLSTEPRGGVRSRPSKGTAAAYLSSVYMTLEDWQKSYDNARWIIDNAGSLNYALAGDFQDVFRESEQWSSQEYIFTVDFTGNLRGGGVSTTLPNDQLVGPFNGVDGGDKPFRGWSMLVPHMNVYSTWDNRDYRLKVSVEDSIVWRADGLLRDYTGFNIPRPHIAKWNRFAGEEKSNFAGWRSDLDYIPFRYAEVLLIAAEAANELGMTPEASSYINQLRARARNAGVIEHEGSGYGTYPPSTIPEDVSGGISQSDFRDLVMEERRIELAFEFKRWYDIVRRDMGAEVFGGSGLEPQGNFSTTKYLLPIPQGEMDRNENFIQNPGY